MPVRAGIKSEEGRFNPSSKTFCARCSERINLRYAFANGKDIFLCEKHYDEWMDEAERDPELVRQIPGKQRKGISDKGLPIPNQDKRFW